MWCGAATAPHSVHRILAFFEQVKYNHKAWMTTTHICTCLCWKQIAFCVCATTDLSRLILSSEREIRHCRTTAKSLSPIHFWFRKSVNFERRGGISDDGCSCKWVPIQYIWILFIYRKVRERLSLFRRWRMCRWKIHAMAQIRISELVAKSFDFFPVRF